MSNFSELRGKALTAVIGMDPGSYEVRFECEDGSVFRMTHHQDCCERVTLYDVVGDPADLIGEVLHCTEDMGDTHHPDDVSEAEDMVEDVFKWTFYNIGTRRGWVTLRWFGTSNGYYGVSVDFEKIK